jgi:hypothetical protein
MDKNAVSFVVSFDGKTLSVAASSSKGVRCAVNKYTVPSVAYVSCGTPRIVSAVDDWLDEARPDVTDLPEFDPVNDRYFGVAVKGGEAFTIESGVTLFDTPRMDCCAVSEPTTWGVIARTGYLTKSPLWTSKSYLWARGRILLARYAPLWVGVLVGVHSVDVSDIFHGFGKEGA